MKNILVTLDNAHTSDRLVLGPFEFVQCTYLLLRDDDDHELASYDLKSGYWTTPDGRRFTDLIVATESHE